MVSLMEMVKRCVYCSVGVKDDSVVDMCERCMYQVWGEKMAKTIVANMERERDAGNLDLGQVSQSETIEKELEPKVIVEEVVEAVPEVSEVSAEELVMEDVRSNSFDRAETL